MEFLKKIFGTKHDTIPASEPETVRVDENPTIPPPSPDKTIRDLRRPKENKYDPAQRVDMTREELVAGIDEMADKKKANEFRRALGIPEK